MAFDFEDWYNDVGEHDTLYAYSGEMSVGIINKTLDEVEDMFYEKGISRKKVRKAYNAIVEGVQNLYHHSISKPNSNGEKFGAFLFKLRNDEIEIITGNYIFFDGVDIIKDRINQINTLDKDEVKALYKKILSNQEFSDKGGGGLGMVDIAKRTGSKLKYSFFEFDEKYSFFELRVKV